MFLDESHIWPRRDEPPPRRPAFRHEKAISRMMLGYAFFLLLLPVSLGGIVDLVRYLIDLATH